MNQDRINIYHTSISKPVTALAKWIYLMLLFLLFSPFAIWAQPNIVKAEYFFDTDPGFGNAANINITPGATITDAGFTSNIVSLDPGVHQLYIRVQDANGIWSITNRTFLYKPGTPGNASLANIVEAEYFFDTEPGFGNGVNIPVTMGTVITDASFTANIEALTTGVHQMFIRVKDANGIWSVTNRTFLYKPGTPGNATVANIVKAEYFFDTEPGFGNGVNIPVTMGTVITDASFTANIEALTTGVHQMFIRVKDANGIWSVTNRTFFYKPGTAGNATIPNIVKAEYFFDTEPGFGSGTDIPVSSGTIITDASFTASINSLSTGVHQLFVRVKDANGNWSISNRTFFYKASTSMLNLPNLSKAEYFFDIDPGFGNATPVTITAGTQTTNQVFLGNFTSLSTGTHKLFIRALDADGKWSITNFTSFEVTASPPLACTVTQVSPVGCTGQNNGSATVSATGGNGNYTYLWDNNETTATATGLGVGLHNVTVTDGNANTTTCSITITQAPTLTCSITQVNPASCGQNNGSATVTASGGNGGNSVNSFRYIKILITSSWAYGNSPTVGTIATLSELKMRWDGSSHFLTGSPFTLLQGNIAYGSFAYITDGEAELINGIHIVGSPVPFEFYVDLATPKAVTAIEIAPQGGLYNMPKDFQIFGSNDASNWQLLATESSTYSSGTGVGQWLSGNYYNVNLQSGSGPGNYTYLWDNNQTTVTATGLNAGQHSVTVTDGSGCTTTCSVTITQATTSPVITATVTNSTCATSCNGSVALQFSGGTAPYTFLTNDFEHHFDGTTINLSLFTKDNVGNYSQNDELILQSNGAGWDKYFYTTQTFSREVGKTFTFRYFVPSNTYSMIGWHGNSTGGYPAYYDMIYAIECADNGTLWIYEDGSPKGEVSGFVGGGYSVNTWYDGKIILKSTGADYYLKKQGQSTYSLIYSSSYSSETNLRIGMTHYSPGTIRTDDWVISGGSSNPPTTGLCPGTYTYSIVDANGCQASASVVITGGTPLTCTATQLSPAACGQNNGSATVTPIGGSGPYSYLWDNSETSATATGLSGGLHTVTVTDAGGCTTTCSVTITVTQTSATVTAEGPTTFCAGGSVLLSANTGQGYTYQWKLNGGNISGATGSTYTATAAGSYTAVVTVNSCFATSAAVVVTTTPPPVWYLDQDDDGYGTGATITQCTRPPHGYLANELISITGDCDDNNPNINASQQYFTYSGTTGFTSSVINPANGTSYTQFRFEVEYFDANNQLPLGSYPRVILDYEGNGIFTDANDRILSMVPEDANDLNTADGKRYIVTFTGLPYGVNYQTRIVANDANSCSTIFGPFNYPDVVQLPNISIFANDIKFSKFRTDVGETITVTADVHNTSDQPAENFVVKLVSQYNPAEVFANRTISYLPAYANTTVSWTIQTPNVPAWVPMQVFIDYTNVINESNELDNTAVRPYVNGDYPVPGNIVTTANTSPSVLNICYSNTLTLSGNAIYINTAVVLPDPSVAGATVDFKIVETGATYSGYTNSLGQYSITFPAPPPGIYHITGTTTDYTLTGNFTSQFTVINQCPIYQVCTLADLSVSISLSENSIVQGNSITGTVTVINGGQTASPPTVLALSQSGGSPLVQTIFNVDSLNAGASQTFSLGTINFPTPGYYSIYANADATQLVEECSEINNYYGAPIEVRPNLPDIIPVYGPKGSAYLCQNPATGFTLYNAGGVAAGPFITQVKVKLNGSVIATYNINIPSIGYHQYYSFNDAHVYTQLGLYSYEIECDIPVASGGVVAELNENNNTAVYNDVFTVLECKPDLYVQSCSTPIVLPVNPQAGGTITLNAQIANSGNATAIAPFTVRFTYSTSEVYSVILNSNLAAGSSIIVNLNAPAPNTPGTVLTIDVDPLNEIDELNESNNQFQGNLCHDLQPVPTCNNSLFSGTVLLYSSAIPWVPVRTNFLYRSQNVKVKFEVSGPGITGTQHLGTVTISEILNSCSCPGIASLVDPFAFNQLGIYIFTFTVDPDNEFAECNEDNNVLQTQILVVNQPDMRVLSQYINPSKLNPAPGESVTFDISYENLGRANVADSMKLKILVNGQPHDSLRVSGLVHGDKTTKHISTSWSSTLYGAHIIRAIIDADNEVAELNELNNEATRAIIVGTAANLYFHSFSSSNSTPNLGEVIQLNATIRNEGDQACDAKVQFYYCNNSGSQVFIGELPVILAAQGETSISLPWSVANNSTTLTAKIVNTSVLEFNNNDNEATTQLGSFAVTIAVTHASCAASNGSLTATASGGTAPYFYQWNTGYIGQTLTAGPGTYTVTITDNTGQSISASSIINSAGNCSDPLSVDFLQAVNINCHGGNSGSIDVSVIGGVAPFTFAWTKTGDPQFSASTEDINNLTAGTYHLTVTDIFSTTSSLDVILSQPVAALSAIMSHEDVLCSNSSTGSATITTAGGTVPYSYSWNTVPVQTTSIATGLTAGNYTVTITDANQCTTSASVTITQPAAALSATTSKVNVLCFGNNTGSATVTAAGGTGPYSYSWNTVPVQTTSTATGLTVGNYTVTITDANQCTTSTFVTITQPAAALSATTSKVNVLCFGNNTGYATVTAASGTEPYSYSWNTTPVQTTATTSSLIAGNYTVTITDANQCSTSASVTITQPAAALSATTSKVNVLCYGNNTGSATVTPTGGTGPYSYSWNTTPVQTTATVSGLVAGNYSVTITDANQCTTSVSVTITQPTAALSASTSQVNVLCFGNNTGSATVTVTGGAGAYSYLWNTVPIQTTSTATGLTAGNYTVTITDANQCTTSVSVTITQPTAALSASTSEVNVLCFGNNTGSATVTVTGGTGAYSYLWNTVPFQTTSTATGLTAGNYTVTITDANQCTTSVSVTITQPTAALSASTSQVNVLCFGNNTGSANVTVTGGTGAYSYLWNTVPIQTTSTATVLTAGNYTVTITDANQCTTSISVTITQPTAALSASTSEVNVLCFGNNTGSATVTVTGGTGAYSYLWNTVPIQTTSTATGLTAGNYNVTITDANQCTTSISVTITQPTAALSASTSQVNVLCFGNNTGSANVTVTGGTGAYSYSWNTVPVQTASTATGLSAGNYTVTITDANQCTTSASVTITQPPAALSASTTQVNVLCFGNSTGTATVNPAGGNSPYTFSWNTVPVQTTQTATGLAAGTYMVTVTDNNGCITTPNVTISQPAAALTVTANGTSLLCYGNASANASGGTAPYSYLWSNGSTTQSISNLLAGTYTATVTDLCGTSTTCSYTVIGYDTENPVIFCPPNVTINFGQSIDPSVRGTATATDNCPAVTITYTDVSTQTPNGSGNTNFTITRTWKATDRAGNIATCNQTIKVCQISVTLGTNRYVLFGALGYAGCTAVTPVITGGVSQYSYSWTSSDGAFNGFTTSSINPCVTNEVTRTYTVVVIDNNGCTATATVNITFINISCSNNGNNVKVKVCHLPPGNPNNCQTLCVSINAYQALLDNGSYLGECLPQCVVPPIARSTSFSIDQYLVRDESFQVKVMNNPTETFFRLSVSGGNFYDKINIRVMDISGRLIEQRVLLYNDHEIRLGDGYVAGVYLAEIRKGNNSKTIKLIKQ